MKIMQLINRKTAVAATIAAAVSVSGCTSQEVKETAAGAGIGAVLGCAAGAIFGGSDGCAKGAAVGAVMGMVTVAVQQYHARQVRSSEADRRVYGLSQPVSSPQVKIQKTSTWPTQVRPGETLDVRTDYSVRLPENQSTTGVERSWELVDVNGKNVPLGSKQISDQDGGHQGGVTVTIPKSLKPGRYTVRHKVKAGSSYDTKTSSFVVKA
jgi:hypothetical protein